MKKIDFDTLMTFCTDNVYHPCYGRPCLKGGYWCATDGRILVMAKESICEDNIQGYDEVLMKYPNVFAVFNPSSFEPMYKVGLNDIESALAKLPMEEEYALRDVETGYETCEACFGLGQLKNDVLFRGRHIEYATECPICHGYGRVPVSAAYNPDIYDSPEEFVDKVKVKTGRMVIKEDAVVTIDNETISALYIEKVKTFMSQLGVDNAYIFFNKGMFQRCVVFKFSEVYVVLACMDKDVNDKQKIKVTKI